MSALRRLASHSRGCGVAAVVFAAIVTAPASPAAATDSVPPGGSSVTARNGGAVSAVVARGSGSATAVRAAAPKNTIPGSGTYLVGKDFNAGVYRSVGNSSCYWQRASDVSGSMSSIIANDIGSAQRLVYVKPTDKAFMTSGCTTWNRVTAAAMSVVSTKTTIPGNGVYFVGSDFRPGTYRSTGNTDFCYWERARSADGASASTIANEFAKGQLVVSITPGGIFQSSGCMTWTRIG